jgi:class 3 adenylate cyclase
LKQEGKKVAMDSPRMKNEIGHVLSIDLVGYSLLSMEEQLTRIQKLNETVGQTAEFRRARAEGELLSLGTGDGVVLVFVRDTLAPVLCACEIAYTLNRQTGDDDGPLDLPLRMGINSGVITRIRDLNGNENVIGDGINMAQRVMDCGDAGHILLGRATAEILGQFKEWAPYLVPLGECRVKHGVNVSLFNLHRRQGGHNIGNPALPTALQWPASEPLPGAETGGPVPLLSPYYLVRPADRDFSAALARRDSIVLVKGTRQTGKTSLLARGLSQARQAGMQVVLTDFQKLNSTQLRTADTLFMTLAALLADELELNVKSHDVWNSDLGAGPNLERFLRRYVLEGRNTHLVWALDELDWLFSCPYHSEVFGLFRSWHNRRILDPAGPWSRLTLAIAYATEAHLFITDMNQSPFNVGTRLKVEDFSLKQVRDLNVRYSGPLRDEHELSRFYALLNGHPFLTHLGIKTMADHRMTLDELEAQADHEEGPFSDHLRRLRNSLTRDPELTERVSQLLHGSAALKPESFYRLRSAGVIIGETEREAGLRCKLYTTYLQRHLVKNAHSVA